MNLRISVSVIATLAILVNVSTFAQERLTLDSKASLPVPPKVEFVDIAGRAALTAKTEDGGEKAKKFIIETTGGGAAFVDYDRDGHVDLFVNHYVDLDLANTPTPGSGTSCQWKGLAVMCGPRGLKGTRSSLYHNNGDGTFTDVSDKSGVTRTGSYYCFSALTGDFDGDGWPDIY